MREFLLLTVMLTLAACGQSDAPPAAATSATPAPAAEPAVPAAAPAVPAPETPAGMDSSVAEAPAVDTTVAPSAPVAVDVAPQADPVPPSAPAAAPTSAPVAEPAPAPEIAAPAADTAPAAPAAAVAVPADAPYKVVDGRIDADTVEGWKIYRGIGTCATCHGPVGQGGVGPALVESLKEKITKDLFVEVVANGRDGTMMKPFGENPNVMDNIDRIYAYLKARADGVLGPENLIKYPLGKIE